MSRTARRSRADDGVAYLAIQKASVFTRPVWPPVEGTQHMTMHLDFEDVDLEEAVAHAVELGKRSLTSSRRTTSG